MPQQWSPIALHGRATSGRAKPPKIELRGPDGNLCEAYLKSPKFHEKKPQFSLEREWVATQLAQDLHLPCAKVVPVRVNADLVEMARPLGLERELRDGPDVLLASVSLGSGWAEWGPSQPVHKSQLHEASSIYFFDTAIQNGDRVRPNPNLLVKGSAYGLIDHEESFVEAAGTDPEREYITPPWHKDGVSNHIGEFEEHPLWAGLKRHNTSFFDQIVTQWKALSLDNIALYPAQDVFEHWDSHIADKIVDYIAKTIDNIDEIHLQIEAHRCK